MFVCVAQQAKYLIMKAQGYTKKVMIIVALETETTPSVL